MNNNTEQLWKDFNLAEQNPDPGGGILYCMRYSKEKIELCRQKVILALSSLNIFPKEIEQGIAIVPDSDFDKNDHEKLMCLLEELSVLNEALEYKQMGIDDINNIFELKTLLVFIYESLLKEKKLSDAYNFVDSFIPQIIKDLLIADKQNKVLSNKDKQALKELDNFSKKKVDFLNDPTGYIMLRD